MNKRQRRKFLYKTDKKEIYYLKLLINKNDKYNPVIKCKNLKKFIDSIYKYRKLYHCDMAVSLPDYNKTLD